jgi:tRNA dimethylallyltransferase
MLDQGWLAEIRWIQTNYGKNLPLLRTIGYAEMTDFLEGKSTITQAINQATTSTYQFAKRQRTWFASDPRIHWIERSTELGELLNLIHDGKNWQVHPRNDTTHHAP